MLLVRAVLRSGPGPVDTRAYVASFHMSVATLTPAPRPRPTAA